MITIDGLIAKLVLLYNSMNQGTTYIIDNKRYTKEDVNKWIRSWYSIPIYKRQDTLKIANAIWLLTHTAGDK